MKQSKTNALRLLDSAGIRYTPLEYVTADGALDGISVAHKTGRDTAAVFKTLVARGASGQALVFCIPVAQELDLKMAARAAGEKSAAMLPAAQLTPLTGYVKGGCSPLGMKKMFPTFIDASAQGQALILVSGGRVGLQVELAPAALADAARAAFAPLCRPGAAAPI